MRKRWIIFVIIAFSIVISWFAYQKITDGTYKGMSIIPEQRTDIPLFKGLKPTSHNYIMEGDHCVEIYNFYMNVLPRNGWKVDSLSNTNDSENNWSGFMSWWEKEEFDGKLMVSTYYKQTEKQTVVIFDKQSIISSTAGNSKSSPNMNSETLDLTKLSEFAAEKFSEYMGTQNIKSYEIGETRIAYRSSKDKHFVYVAEAAAILKESEQKEKIKYGFDIIINKNGDFEILHQGKEVNETYLLK